MKDRENISAEIWHLWHIYAEKYCSGLATYEELLQKRSELGIRPLRRLPKYVLNDYPDIPFLRFSENFAKLYLNVQSTKTLKILLKTLRGLEHNYAYNTVQTRIVDFKYEISNHDTSAVRKNCFLNPDKVCGKSKMRGRGKIFQGD